MDINPIAILWNAFGPVIYIFGALAVFAAFVLAARILFGKRDSASATKETVKPLYEYTSRSSIMTRAEQDFFHTLVAAVGHDFCIFAQVHLDAFLDEKVKGQNWRAARAHISQKSVDFLLCDKRDLSPRLAIELDDRSHEREDRKERDGEVERILSDAGVPLLRLENTGRFDRDELARKVKDRLAPPSS